MIKLFIFWVKCNIQYGIGVNHMIESIYSNEGGEDNRTNRVQPSFKMPKNIRQVGKSSVNKKIYVEDYVMTYIKQISGDEYTKCKVAVLVGQYVKMDNCRNIFINGAVEVEGIDTSTREIVFTNEAWTNIYENIKKYFVEAEIVGWFIGGPGYLLDEDSNILKAHIDNFAGQDKTLLTYDNLEKEESFLIYENNRLCKQEGYYIYYEKNEEMQTYMIDHKNAQSEEVFYDDRVSRDIRTKIQNKKPAPATAEETKSVSKLMYAAGTLMAVIILVVAAAMLDNYGQMKALKDTINNLSQKLQITETNMASNTTITPTIALIPEGNTSSDSSLNIEFIPGNVQPLEEEETNSEKPSEKDDNKKEETNQTDTKQTESTATQSAKVTVAPEKKESKEVKAEVKYYTVADGDTLAGICLKLYGSVNNLPKIKELNNIENENFIMVGQRLIVP